MPVYELYSKWSQRLQQLVPDERKTRRRNMAWLLAGLFLSQLVYVRKIAEKLPWSCTLPSATRRLSRFLQNHRVRVRDWYEPVARRLLHQAHELVGEVRLIVDGTKVGFRHQLLMVSLAFQRRSLPIAWTWIPKARGHSSAYKQRALLDYVRSLLPVDAQVLLVGDSEFGAGSVLEQLDHWGWSYVLRQKSNHLIWTEETGSWRSFGSLVSSPGDQQWVANARLTQKHAYPVNLLAIWKPGEDEPWLLTTNVDTARAAQRAYRRRMWVDEMFADFKTNGFDLERSQLRHFRRLSRLTLAVALLYVWLVAMGSRTIKEGERDQVDRPDRRDLSVFQIGCSMIERLLAHAQPIPSTFIPYFS